MPSFPWRTWYGDILEVYEVSGRGPVAVLQLCRVCSAEELINWHVELPDGPRRVARVGSAQALGASAMLAPGSRIYLVLGRPFALGDLLIADLEPDAPYMRTVAYARQSESRPWSQYVIAQSTVREGAVYQLRMPGCKLTFLRRAADAPPLPPGAKSG